MKKKERFFVYLPCKPYVKQYLLHNYSAADENYPDAVSFASDKSLMSDFRSRITHQNNRYDKRYDELTRYSEVVQVEIKKDDFYRYGWALSNSDVVSFCSALETRVKSMMCTYLDMYRAVGIPLASAIRSFQGKYGYNEDIWSTDTIRREYNRNGSKISIDIKNYFFNKIDQIIMENLSRNGTISQQGLKRYENI